MKSSPIQRSKDRSKEKSKTDKEQKIIKKDSSLDVLISTNTTDQPVIKNNTQLEQVEHGKENRDIEILLAQLDDLSLDSQEQETEVPAREIRDVEQLFLHVPIDIQLILFDLDNTLIQTDDLKDFRGSRFVRRQPVGYLDNLKRDFFGKVNRQLFTIEYLRRLQQRFEGVRLGVVTNSPRLYARSLLEFAYPGFTWDVLITHNDVQIAKPSAQGIQKAMNKLGMFSSERVVMVGNDESDIIAAYRAGCWAVLYSPHGGPNVNLIRQKLMPDATLRAPEELERFISAPGNYLLGMETQLRENRTGSAISTQMFFADYRMRGSNIDAKPVQVMCLGRYFPRKINKRADWSHLSRSILQHKNSMVFDDSWIRVLTALLIRVDMPLIVTTIPAKSGRLARLEALLSQLQDATEKKNNYLSFALHLFAYSHGVRSHHSENIILD